MSQSKSAYGSRDLEGTEQRQRQRQKSSERKEKSQFEHEHELEPACWRRHVDEWQWHSTAFTAAYRGIHAPCLDCFDGPPDVAEIETVVRSCSHPTKYHREWSNETDGSNESPSESSIQEPDTDTGGSRFADALDAACEPLSTIAELREGDGVFWEPLETPLVVAERDGESGPVSLVGPAGGEYVLRKRHDSALLVYPGYGEVSVSRIPAMDDRMET